MKFHRNLLHVGQLMKTVIESIWLGMSFMWNRVSYLDGVNVTWMGSTNFACACKNKFRQTAFKWCGNDRASKWPADWGATLSILVQKKKHMKWTRNFLEMEQNCRLMINLKYAVFHNSQWGLSVLLRNCIILYTDTILHSYPPWYGCVWQF